MDELLIINSLRELQAKGTDLSEKLNTKLTELYKWYNKELDLISDDMFKVLNTPIQSKNNSELSSSRKSEFDIYNSDYKTEYKSNVLGSKLELERRSTHDSLPIELSFNKLSARDRVVEVEGPDYGTKSWPRFWLYALLGCRTSRMWVSDEDFEILEHLSDIRVEVFEANENSEFFEISFHFTENPYFHNARLWRRFQFDKNLVNSESSEIDWARGVKPEFKTGFFRFFGSEIEFEDMELALTIKDRIRRNPLKYVLRYQSHLQDKESESDSDVEPTDSSRVGARYPFSWLFSK